MKSQCQEVQQESRVRWRENTGPPFFLLGLKALPKASGGPTAAKAGSTTVCWGWSCDCSCWWGEVHVGM